MALEQIGQGLAITGSPRLLYRVTTILCALLMSGHLVMAWISA